MIRTPMRWRCRTPPSPCSRARRLAAAILVVTAASVLSGAPAAYADTATIAPVADAYIRSDHRDTNYGASPRISAEAASLTRRACLRFDVQLPSGSTVTKATLRVRSLTAGAGNVDLRGVSDNSWGERTLTFRNAP